MTLRVALIQLTSNDDIAANIARIETFVAEAAKKGATFVTLPENAFCMEVTGAKRTFYTEEEHPAIAASAAMAKNHGVWLLVGSVAIKIDDSGKTVNRSLLFNYKGQLVASYDKIHLFDVDVGDGQSYRESAKMLPGDRAVLVKAPWGKLGMTICYDVRFPQLYRVLAQQEADIIAVPSAFTAVTGEAHWHVLLRARAIENGCFIIAPAQVGIHSGNRKTFGHSLVVDPWGKILTDGGTEEGVTIAEINVHEVARARAKIPSLAHDRKFD